MGFFSNTRQVSLKRQGVYLASDVMTQDPTTKKWDGVGTQNKFKVLILAVKEINSRGKGYAVEFEILESTYDKNKPGSKASWYLDFMKQPEAATRDFMFFVAACFGVDASDEDRVREVATDEMLDYVSDPSNPLAEYKLIMEVDTVAALTKNDKAFTRHYWHAAENPPPVAI
jgi:hypothetical protein